MGLILTNMIIHGISMLLEFIGAIVICMYGVEESDGNYLFNYTYNICSYIIINYNMIIYVPMYFSIDQRVE